MSTVVRQLPLIAIVLVALALRLYGLNWDDGFHLHPDERFIAMVSDRIELPDSPGEYFDTAASPLNPYNNGFDGFAYGTLPLFLGRLLGELTGYDGYDRIVLLGRALSALADTGSVLFAYLLGRQLYGRRAGLLAAALLALAVLPIQLSHFYAFDTFLTFFVAWSLYFAYRAWAEPRWPWLVLLGIGVGFSVACKVSALTLLPIAGLALLPWPGRSWSLGSAVPRGGVVALSALVAYRVTSPYAFLGTSPFDLRPNPKFVADMLSWIRISSGEIEVPFMIQWAHTPKYSFVVDSIVRWGLGHAAGLAALAGFVLALYQLRRWQSGARHLLLLAWVGLNLVYFGGQFAKFMRYLLPIYPALAVLAGFFLSACLARAAATPAGRGWRSIARSILSGLPLAVVVASGLWALAFVQIYGQPNTRLTASRWMYQHLAAGSVLALEHWDDGLPLQLPGERRQRFRDVSMNLYDDESAEKRRKLLDNLAQADYVVLASNRLYGSIPRLPERYPLATEYYRALFDGRLGLEVVAEFTSRPRLGGLEIVDDRAQEDFTVYDHPKIQIFGKRDDYDQARVAAILGGVSLDSVQKVKPVEAESGRAPLLSADEWADQQASGTWSELFDQQDVANRFPVISWWLLTALLGLAAWPLLSRLTPRLPDRGYGFARLTGILLTAYLAWLLASLRLLPFGRGSLALGLLLLAGLSVLTVGRRAELLGFVRREWRCLLVSEAAFTAGFLIALGMRLVNPDLWHANYGGEKPMDFAYLNAVVKSDYFPPYDPWFAGGSINYYYFGFVLVAGLIKLSGSVPAVAYNLALATWYGLLWQGAFSLTYNLALGRTGPGPRRRLALASGGLAAIFVAFAGNLDGAAQVRDQLWRAAKLELESGVPLLGGLLRALVGLGALLRDGTPLRFDFWRSTRIIGPEEPGPITEFPFFTFLYGDLHAHLLALPLTLLALGLALELSRSVEARRLLDGWGAALQLARRDGPRLGGLLLLASLVVGALRATNTWDYPTYLAALALGLACLFRPLRLAQAVPSGLAIAAGCAGLFLLSGLLIAPYLERYQLFYTGLSLSASQTAVSQFLTVNGFWLFVLASYLILASVRAGLGRLASQRAVSGSAAYYSLALPLPASWAFDSAWAGWGLALLLAVLVLWTLGLGTVALLLALGAGIALLAARRWASREQLFSFGLAGLALGTLALPDLVTLKGDVGRMNTVFKFYLQAWVLLAVLSALWLPRLVLSRPGWERLGPTWRRAWLVATAFLAGCLLIYPLWGGPTKLALRFERLPPTLDGMAFMEVARYRDRERDVGIPADLAAIRWLQDEVRGSPVILEASVGLYKWGSRVSVYTGLPTVIGWDWHQKQQRVSMAGKVDERLRDVKTMYESPRLEQALPLLRKYNIRYVYVGGLERLYYPAAGLEKFETAPADLLGPVYRGAGVTIYEVRGAA